MTEARLLVIFESLGRRPGVTFESPLGHFNCFGLRGFLVVILITTLGAQEMKSHIERFQVQTHPEASSAPMLVSAL